MHTSQNHSPMVDSYGMRRKDDYRPSTRALIARFGLVCLAVFSFVYTCAATELSHAAPDWSLDTAAGETVSFHAHAEARPAVLLFWATWCPYCRALLPHLETLHDEFKARGARFYALNIWEDGDASAYFREHGYEIPLILAADMIAEEYGVKGTPGVFVTDRSHRISYVRNKGTPPEAVEAAVRAILERELAADTAQ